MDDVDVKILKLLWDDGRMPIYAIAREIGLSNGAIHKRISAMMERGELKGFSILLNSDRVLNSAVISIRARKKRSYVMEVLGELSGTMHVVAGFGGRYYAEIWYGDEYELKDKVNYLKHLTGAYRIEVYKHRKADEAKLTSLDWKILLALKDDARKPFSEVAETIGVSSKTVANRCRRLKEFDVCKVYPVVNRPSSKEIFWFSLFIETEDVMFESRIRKIKNLWRTSTFAEPPMVYGVFYGRTIEEVDEIMETVVDMPNVKRVFYEIIVKERFYPNYVDYVATKVGFRED